MTYAVCRPNFRALDRDLDTAFGNLFNFTNDLGNDSLVPRVNIHESDEEIRLTFEIAGMKSEDIKVTVKDNLLTVSGRREFKSEKVKAVRTELRTGEFSRSFTIPETVDANSVTADYRNGLLQLVLKKKEEVKPKEIEIKVS